MKYFTKTIGDKEFNFRLTNEDACNVENKINKNILEAVMDATSRNVAIILKYMLKGDTSAFKSTGEFVDFLVDEGYSLETIYTDIIFPCCVESGILTRNDLNKIMEAITNKHNNENNEVIEK